jgi:hypothetical protein
VSTVNSKCSRRSRCKTHFPQCPPALETFGPTQRAPLEGGPSAGRNTAWIDTIGYIKNAQARYARFGIRRKQNDYLEKGFSLDFKGQSFQILSGTGNQATPVDANYLVTYMEIIKSKS